MLYNMLVLIDVPVECRRAHASLISWIFSPGNKRDEATLGDPAARFKEPVCQRIDERSSLASTFHHHDTQPLQILLDA